MFRTNKDYIQWQHYLWLRKFGIYCQVETRTLEEVNEVLQYASRTKTYLTRIMLDNMVVPQPNGDVDVSMLKEAVDLINGRFETEVHPIIGSPFICRLFLLYQFL